jgi:hypothetical protein
MKWIALFLLMLVACTLPQPVSEEKESIEKDEEDMPIIESSEETTKEMSEETEKTEKEESKVSPITGAVVGIEDEEYEEEKETITPAIQTKEISFLNKDNVMDYLVELFAKKIQSYKFTINEGEVLVRGNQYKLTLKIVDRVLLRDEETQKTSQNVITTIYFDRNKKTAIGYCEGKDTGIRRECEKKELLDVPRTLNFFDYDIILPEDLLWEFFKKEVDFVETDKYYANGKKTIRVHFKEDDIRYDVFFDETSGLPLRVIKIKDVQTITYDFNRFSFNTVKKNEVIHRNLHEIPSEEYFFR